MTADLVHLTVGHVDELLIALRAFQAALTGAVWEPLVPQTGVDGTACPSVVWLRLLARAVKHSSIGQPVFGP